MSEAAQRWFNGDFGKLTREQAEIAAEMADELMGAYLPADSYCGMLEALEVLGWEA